MTGGATSHESGVATGVRHSVGLASQAPRPGASNMGQRPSESSLLKPGPTKLGPSKPGPPPRIGPQRLGTARPDVSKPGPTKLFPSKPVPPKPGPPTRRKSSASGPSGLGATVTGFGSIPKNTSLSAINRINKKARNEREPDLNSLDLFEASNPVPFSKKPSLEIGRLSPKDLGSLRINKHSAEDRRLLPPRGPSGMSRREKEHGQSHNGDLVMSPAPEDGFLTTPTVDTELGIGKSDLRRNSNKKVFECELMIQRGDEIESLGVVQFLGFSAQFLEYLERQGLRELRVVKLLADSHVSSAVTNVGLSLTA